MDLRSIIAASAMVASTSVFASSYNGTIAAVVCHEPGTTAVCQVQVNGAISQELPCASTPWKYTFNGTTAEGRNILSILLAAQVSRSTVSIEGLNQCNLVPQSEDLRHVFIVTAE